MTTLMNERTTIGGGGGPPAGASGADRRGACASGSDGAGEHDPAQRDRLMQLWIEAEALRLTNIRAAPDRRAGNPGPEGSIAKLDVRRGQQATIYELCVDLLGAGARSSTTTTTIRRTDQLGLVGPPGSARKMFLRSRANSIEGGTSEIQRNILGERVLGLPGEPRTDKELPWNDVPRS